MKINKLFWITIFFMPLLNADECDNDDTLLDFRRSMGKSHNYGIYKVKYPLSLF